MERQKRRTERKTNFGDNKFNTIFFLFFCQVKSSEMSLWHSNYYQMSNYIWGQFLFYFFAIVKFYFRMTWNDQTVSRTSISEFVSVSYFYPKWYRIYHNIQSFFSFLFFSPSLETDESFINPTKFNIFHAVNRIEIDIGKKW